jgi:hypothetical protein
MLLKLGWQNEKSKFIKYLLYLVCSSNISDVDLFEFVQLIVFESVSSNEL